MEIDEEAVWRALGDPAARAMLRRLLEHDGARLDELSEAVGLTRGSASRHVRRLAEAGLVRRQRVGRWRRHWLQPEPILALRDGWMRPYLEACEARSGGPAGSGEGVPADEADAAAGSGWFALESHIKCSPSEAWEALTDAAVSRRFLFGCSMRSTWIPGARVVLVDGSGTVLVRGRVLACERERLLSMTWEVVGSGEAASRVRLEVSAVARWCRVRLRQDGLPAEGESVPEALAGWRQVLDSMKSLLETGTSLGEWRLERELRRAVLVGMLRRRLRWVGEPYGRR